MAFTITKVEVERLCSQDSRFKTICPRCGRELGNYPALSRYANVDICSECGTAEAFESMLTKKRTSFNDWKLGRD